MDHLLSNLQKDFENLFLQDSAHAMHHWVHVTHIINPSSFYVRTVICSEFVNYIGTMEQIPKMNAINLHDVVVIKLEEHSPKYIRGKIVFIDNNASGIKFDILAIDFGYHVKSVPIQDIWECNERFVKLPPLAIHCQLGNCHPFGGKEWNQKTIDAFKYYVGKEGARMIILDRIFDKLVVELYTTNPDDIATLLALTGYSTMGYVPSVVPRT